MYCGKPLTARQYENMKAPVFSFEPSGVQMPTCLIDDGPEISLVHDSASSMTVAVSFASDPPATAASSSFAHVPRRTALAVTCSR